MRIMFWSLTAFYRRTKIWNWYKNMIANAPVDATTGKQVNPFSAFGTPKKGDYLYKDTNGDGVVNSDDRVISSDGTNPSSIMV